MSNLLHTKAKAVAAALALFIFAAALQGCESIDDDRIPAVDVYIPFTTDADWTVYGVAGACTSKRFIKQLREPANFPYPATCYTGYGGVLLCCDIHGNPTAYDLACPVEVDPYVRIYVDPEALIAVCPKCHSTYDVFSNGGIPLSGPAADDGYGLARYRVGPGSQGHFMIVTR